MTRVIQAYLLAMVLALTGQALAAARGQNPVMGTDMVICTGVGMTTVTLGPDGQPVEKVHLCPDGASIFAADFALPVPAGPEWRLVAGFAQAPLSVSAPQHALSPSARGPPVAI